MKILTKEIIRANGKEFHTFEIKKNHSQTPLLFAFDPENETYLLYSDTLREGVIITKIENIIAPISNSSNQNWR